MSLFDWLVEFVAGRRGGDNLGSFIAGQPSVTQFYLSQGSFPNREPGRYLQSAQNVESYPGVLGQWVVHLRGSDGTGGVSSPFA